MPRTPFAIVQGLGSAKGGTGDFIASRLTGLANAFVAVPALIILARLRGADHAALVETFANPLVAVVFLLFIATATAHMKLGMQVIIEDYVHAAGPRLAALTANAFFSYGAGAAAGFGVLSLAMGRW